MPNQQRLVQASDQRSREMGIDFFLFRAIESEELFLKELPRRVVVCRRSIIFWEGAFDVGDQDPFFKLHSG